MTNQKKLKRSEYLRELRKSAGMNQYEAAELLGVSRGTYQRLEQEEAEVSELDINRFEKHLGLIEFDTNCPHCGFAFKHN